MCFFQVGDKSYKRLTLDQAVGLRHAGLVLTIQKVVKVTCGHLRIYYVLLMYITTYLFEKHLLSGHSYTFLVTYIYLAYFYKVILYVIFKRSCNKALLFIYPSQMYTNDLSVFFLNYYCFMNCYMLYMVRE